MRSLGTCIPYLAMVIGLHLWHSAWLSFLLYHGLVLLYLGRDRRTLASLGRGWNGRAAGAAALFGVGGGVLLLMLKPSLGLEQEALRVMLARLDLGGKSWLLFVFYHALVNPWFEEALWRGRLGSEARRPVPHDFLFAGYHGLVLVFFVSRFWLVPAVLVLALAGWYWRQLRRRHGGLLLPVVSHLTADASIMSVVYLVSRGWAG